jgi:glutathione reductase (NADPH)
MSFDYDLFVIGGGSGGVRAGRIAATHGAKVALAEEYRMGGTCVIRGCVPKKLMVYASHFSEVFEDARAYGWSVGETSFDWASLFTAKDAEIERLEGIYRRNLGNAGVEIFDARATVSGTHEVTLSSGEVFSVKTILVATGGAPFVPDIKGKELAITSNEIFQLASQPKRVAIVGGGYIASEFAGILNGMGSEVTQLYRSEQILRGFDEDVRAHVAEEMRRKGIDIRVNTDVSGLEKSGDAILVSLDDGSTLEVDQIMYATGRTPNSGGLGLEELGVALKKNGAIEVDVWSQTNVPSIFAVGDVTDRIALTPVAIREGHAFADTVYGDKPTQVDHENVASAVFTQPEVGTIGMTETEARKEYDVEIYRSTFTAMYHSFSNNGEKTLMKLVVDKASRVVLGVHLVGASAGEMIQMVAIAIKMGATKEQFDAAVAVHPTSAEELVTMRTPVGGS